MNLFQMFQKGDRFSQGIADAAKTTGAVLLDVRSQEEYQSGHVPGSVNCPVDRVRFLDLPQDTPLFVYCYSGGRSARACGQLQSMGYQSVRNIGGISGYQGELEQ